jgi:indolepyruvate ferredoxin oxidoreductase beta subunit
MTEPIKLCIAALGGQGGGVLAGWLIEAAEAQGFIVQSTSVPGVAQRTGATLYYLEFFPRALTDGERQPVLALMPIGGDVDCVLASELIEAGRSVQRGLVTPDRTLVIASTHRAYTISERSALGDGMVDAAPVLELLRESSKHLILFDMAQMAERHGSVISAVMLGALAGSGVLPFSRQSFEDAIRHGALAVKTNLAAFAAAFDEAAREPAQPSARAAAVPGGAVPAAAASIPEHATHPQVEVLLQRLRAMPRGVQSTALEGIRRLIDFQDVRYASLYLDRLNRIAGLESSAGESAAGAGSGALLRETARGLALWMSFEDTIRVADLKTRSARFERVREEVGVAAGQTISITDFVKPRVAEFAGTLPAGLGRALRNSKSAAGWLRGLTGGRRIKTSSLSGFLLFSALAGMKRWRRRTLRYQEENERVEKWLGEIEATAPVNYALAVQIARAQRLVKGYGDTHERGWANFSRLMARVDALTGRREGAEVFAQLQAAALADEEGAALAAALAQLDAMT